MMNTRVSRIVRVAVLGFFITQLFLGYVAPNISQAAVIPDVIDTTKTTSNVPEYTGVEKSIADYLCVPDDSNLGAALYTCVGKIYRFGVAFGAIALGFFLILAGYLYMTGGETGKQKGKGMFTTALTGMLIILSSYVLLNFINPDLVKIKPIQAPIFTASNLPTCEEVGYGQNCVLPSGQVAINGGPLGVGQWKDLINKYSQQYSIDPCIGQTIIGKESGGRANAVGHDNHEGSRDPYKAGSAPYFGLSFETKNWSHGIGLTQITIFPEGSTQGGGNWPTFPIINGQKTPARRADTIPVKGENSSKWYSISELLNPDTSVRLAIGKMAAHMQQTGNNLQESFKRYNGGASYAAAAMQKYNNCKSGAI